MEHAILTDSQHALLIQLGELDVVGEFYMAGGTSLALQLEHRQSEDFDFFSEGEFELELVRSKITASVSNELIRADRQTLYLRIHGISVSFMQYPYPLLTLPQEHPSGVKLASVEDIAAMKLATISGRGAKRDFYDLYTICQQRFSFATALDLHKKKYRTSPTDVYHLLRSVTYYVDAEDDPIPPLRKQIAWGDVKRFFVEEVRKLQ
jgi:predicted nucleotidyltransferase component of viral defense system